jgi:hypothetical protein
MYEREQEDQKIGRYVKTKFTPEEDGTLTHLVTHYGTSNWKGIASLMGTRNARQCRERWNNYLDPKLRHHGITEFVKARGEKDWAKLALLLEGIDQSSGRIGQPLAVDARGVPKAHEVA